MLYVPMGTQDQDVKDVDRWMKIQEFKTTGHSCSSMCILAIHTHLNGRYVFEIIILFLFCYFVCI